MYRSVPGLEHAKIVRNAYAIEYDCLDSLELLPTLELKKVKGLFSAGQANGSSGYEEAAAQGLVAGINAARKCLGKEPIIIDRSQGYVGVLIDDLVTKGTNEPYRMMTSRAEYRLLLRQDNADERLTKLGYEIGLISEERYQHFVEKEEQIKKEINRVLHTHVGNTEDVQKLLDEYESTRLVSGIRLIHGSGSLSEQGKNLQWRIFWLKMLLVQENHSFIYCDISIRRLNGSRS